MHYRLSPGKADLANGTDVIRRKSTSYIMANRIVPEEITHYEPYQDLQRLFRKLCWSAVLKGLMRERLAAGNVFANGTDLIRRKNTWSLIWVRLFSIALLLYEYRNNIGTVFEMVS